MTPYHTIKIAKKLDYLIHWYFWLVGFIYSNVIVWRLLKYLWHHLGQ